MNKTHKQNKNHNSKQQKHTSSNITNTKENKRQTQRKHDNKHGKQEKHIQKSPKNTTKNRKPKETEENTLSNKTTPKDTKQQKLPKTKNAPTHWIYLRPELVFWNLDSSGTGAPALAKDEGVVSWFKRHGAWNCKTQGGYFIVFFFF